MNSLRETILNNVGLVIIFPAAVSVILWLLAFAFHGKVSPARSFILGFSLPLVIPYLLLFGKPLDAPGASIATIIDFTLVRALVFAPQIFILFPIGVVAWINFLRFRNISEGGRRTTLIAIAVVTIAIIGNAWTALALSGLEKSGTTG